LLIRIINWAVFLFNDKFIKALRLEREKISKQILCPFYTVKSFFREHLKCAMRNFTTVFIWIALTSIRFC
jgi:hypothetical protein